MKLTDAAESTFSSNSHRPVSQSSQSDDSDDSDDSGAVLTSLVSNVAERKKNDVQEEDNEEDNTTTNNVRNNYISNDNVDFQNSTNSFVEKSEETTNFLQDALQDNFVFEKIPQEQQDTLIKSMEPEDAAEGDVIIKKGDSGDYFYVLESGNVCVVYGGKADIYTRGYSFGELALIYDVPRAVTCIAASACKLWKIGRQHFRSCMAVNATEEEAKLSLTLRNVPLLSSLSGSQLKKAIDCFSLESFAKGETVIQKGDTGDTFYIIQKGEVLVKDIGTGSSQFVDFTMKEGEYFGERALLTDEPRSATIVTTTDSTFYVMERKYFEKVIGNLKLVLDTQILKSVATFVNSDVTDAELKKLATLFKTQDFEENHKLTKPGKPILQSLYVIEKGVILTAQDNGELIRLQRGDYFGSRSLTRSGTELSTKTVSVEEDAVCKVLTKEDIIGVIGNIDRLGHDLPPVPVVEKLHFEVKDIQKHKVLGVGGYGKVYLASTAKHPEPFALKALSKKQLADADQSKFVLREKNIMYGINHPFLMNMIGCSQDCTHLYFVLPLFQGGDLYDLIHPEDKPPKEHGIPLESAIFYSACVIDALEYLHSRSIAHRDIKPENVLIGKDGYCVIVDFGFAKIATDKTFTLCGTFEYMAPELIIAKGHDYRVDTWACAAMLYEMLVGKSPFFAKLKMKLFKRILKQFYKADLVEDEDARDLVKNILVEKPSDRVGSQAEGMAAVKKHPFFKSIDWEKLTKKELKAPFLPEDITENNLTELMEEQTDPEEIEASSKIDHELFRDFSEHDLSTLVMD